MNNEFFNYILYIFILRADVMCDSYHRAAFLSNTISC